MKNQDKRKMRFSAENGIFGGHRGVDERIFESVAIGATGK
jgi:hypothetical protein